MRPSGGGAAVLAAAAVLAGCASAAARTKAGPVTHPYRAILLPVEGARAALSEPTAEGSLPVASTPEALEARIRDALIDGHLFSELVPVGAEELRGRLPGEEMAAAAEVAIREKADLVLRVQVRTARIRDLGYNSSTAWSCLLWFMVPLPIWSVDDRSYETDFRVHAELFATEDTQRPLASFVVTSGVQSLDLWDRGAGVLVLVCPPPFLPGNSGRIAKVLTDRALQEVTRGLVEEIGRREIPSIFELQVTQAPGGLRLEAASRRKLRSVEVRSGDRLLRSWNETDLEPDEVSPDRGFVYRREVSLDAAAGARTVVRVLADDEVGGREVRTLILGGTGP